MTLTFHTLMRVKFKPFSVSQKKSYSGCLERTVGHGWVQLCDKTGAFEGWGESFFGFEGLARPCQVQQLGRGPRERLPECQSPTQPHIRTGHRALFQGYIRCRCPETLQHLQGRLSTFWIPIQAWEHGPGLVCHAHATYVRKIHWFIVNLFSSTYP